MEPEKIFNTHSKRFITKNSVQYNKLIKEGFYIEDNKLYSSKPHEKKYVKRTTSFATILIPTLNHILKELPVNDLLSLYITNKEAHGQLNNVAFLKTLSDKYKVPRYTSFVDFLTNYNLLFIPFNQQYLYKLENNIEMPTYAFYNDFAKNIRNVTPNMRAILIDWMYEVARMYMVNKRAVGLSITYLDAYLAKVNISKDTLQALGCMCLYVANVILDETATEMSDFVYITDGAFSSEALTAQLVDLMKVLNGIMIRPSVIFYVDIHDQHMMHLAIISYYSTRLMLYKPSLIYESMHYMLYGSYKIYTLEEINNVCSILTERVNRGKSSLESFNNAREKIIDKIKYECKSNTTPMKLSNFIYHHEWHINVDTPIKKMTKLGEGTYGNVKHIQVCSNDYAVKTSIGYLDQSLREIIILQNLANHPNIISICNFDIFTKNNKTKIYMPLMEISLTKIINENKLNTDKYPIYFKQMIEGIQYCHACDIIIRDIKDQNIVYSEAEDQFKIIDFGISLPFASYHTTLDPDMAGTLWYTAPEALLGDSHYTTKIDIWSIGCVFVFMINKRQFFTGDCNIDQLYKIFQICGTSNEKTWPGVTTLPNWKTTFPQWKSQNLKNFIQGGKYLDILEACFTMDPSKRADTQQLLDILHDTYHV